MNREMTVQIWACDETGWNLVGTVEKAKNEAIHLTYDNKIIADVAEVKE